MAKLEQLDADLDDDCCEIDIAEFARKVQLKSSDDVVVVAAKGQIKVEVDQTEAAVCLDVSASGDNLRVHAAGDRLDYPYEIDDDETIADVLNLSDDECVIHVEEAIPDKLEVKCETEGSDGVGEEDEYDHLPEINGSIFNKEDDDDDFVIVGR